MTSMAAGSSYTSDLVDGQLQNISFHGIIVCQLYSMPILYISSVVMQSGMSMHNSMRLTVLHLLGLSLSLCLIVVSL